MVRHVWDEVPRIHACLSASGAEILEVLSTVSNNRMKSYECHMKGKGEGEGEGRGSIRPQRRPSLVWLTFADEERLSHSSMCGTVPFTMFPNVY